MRVKVSFKEIMFNTRSVELNGTSLIRLRDQVANLDGMSPVTVFIEAKQIDSPSQGWIVKKCADPGNTPGFLLFMSATYLQLLVQAPDGSRLRVQSATTLCVNQQWGSLTCSLDGSGTAAGVRMQLDGEDVPMTTIQDNLSASAANTEPVEIGQGLVGRLCQHQIYGTELTSAEQTALVVLPGVATPVDPMTLPTSDKLLTYFQLGPKPDNSNTFHDEVGGNLGHAVGPITLSNDHP